MSDTQTTTDAGSAVAEKPSVPSVKAILAQKLGMTQVVRPSGEFIGVTVLQAGPCPILQVKTQEKDGYTATALQLGLGSAKEKNVTGPLVGHFKKAGVAPVRWVREVRVPKVDGFAAGQEVLVSNFAAGDVVDVSGVNKGKGFAGGVKRHRFKGGPATHGQSDRERAPGSLGGQQPQKVFRGLRGPGHMGAVWSTVQCVEVVSVDAAQNLMLIRGSVPGPNGSCITVRQTIRPRTVKKSAPAPAAKKSAKPEAKKK
jgi:large subunit ribosomal protein L3